MNTHFNMSVPTYDNAFGRELSLDAVRQRAPAVFAGAALDTVSPRYTFIPTASVLTGLMNVGFVPVDARQNQTRRASPLHARHAVRFRRRFETVSLNDSILELLLLNSHDGRQTYQVHLSIFRVVCCNGLIASRGAFPSYAVSHRGNVVDEVIEGALRIAERFEGLAAQVERMQQRRVCKDEQVGFAEAALALRYPDTAKSGLQAAQLLTCRRVEDLGDDLWRVTNVVQENLLRGGLSRRSESGRLMRTRRIISLSRDVELNSRLWELATEVLIH
jgi:hypothetical protein